MDFGLDSRIDNNSKTDKVSSRIIAADKIINAAEELFYKEGIQAIGVDRIVKHANVAMNTFYKHFPSKDLLIETYLKNRDSRWMDWLNEYIKLKENPRDKVFAIFNALDDWFQEKTYRGCAFINASGELGEVKHYINQISREHKDKIYKQIYDILNECLDEKELDKVCKQIMILVEGAIVQSYINCEVGAAKNAKEVASLILDRYSI